MVPVSAELGVSATQQTTSSSGVIQGLKLLSWWSATEREPGSFQMRSLWLSRAPDQPARRAHQQPVSSRKTTLAIV